MRTGLLIDGLESPEGPLYLGNSQWLVTEMGSGAITKVGPAAWQRAKIATTGRPNGLAIDLGGAVWIAESLVPSVMRLDTSLGTPVVVTDTASDEPLLWPNDLCFGPDGTLYVTDSGIRIGDFEGEGSGSKYDIELDGRVVAVDPLTGDARILDRGLQFANGIAIGPNNEFLYVNETLTGLIHRYPLGDICRATRQTFGNVLQSDPRSYGAIAGPDGMAFDSEGTLLVAVLTQGTLTTLTPQGEVANHVALPDSFPTNVAFGGEAGDTALVTGAATGSLYTLDWNCPGLELHRPSLAISPEQRMVNPSASTDQSRNVENG